jgi:RHS repeat-associated protein
VSATDGANNTVTNNYQVAANNGTALSWIYDANGNFSYGPNEGYSFDPENRLQYIDFYTPNTPRTEYDHDALGRCVAITVYSSFGVISSQKIYVWSGNEIIQEQDASGNVTKDYCALGENRAGTNYFYTKDHLGSIRELTDGSGNIQAQYCYDPFGQATKIQGALDCDFQYAGYFYEATSGFNLTRTRAYSANLARWISRDPIDDDNLFKYVNNNPVSFIDPSGLLMSPAVPSVPNPMPNQGGGGAAAAGGAPPPGDDCRRRAQEMANTDTEYQDCLARADHTYDSLEKQYTEQQQEELERMHPRTKCGKKKKNWTPPIAWRQKWEKKWRQLNFDRGESYHDCFIDSLNKWLRLLNCQ